jgi:hypothetical protein
MTKPVADNEFRLSRVQAQGWIAGRGRPSDEELEDGDVSKLNPFPSDPERARWSAGFRSALKSLEKK